MTHCRLYSTAVQGRGFGAPVALDPAEMRCFRLATREAAFVAGKDGGEELAAPAAEKVNKGEVVLRSVCNTCTSTCSASRRGHLSDSAGTDCNMEI